MTARVKKNYEVFVACDVLSNSIDGSIRWRKRHIIPGDLEVNVMINTITNQIKSQFSEMDDFKILHLSFQL